MNFNEARAESYAESWWNAGKDDESVAALHSFLKRKFESENK